MMTSIISCTLLAAFLITGCASDPRKVVERSVAVPMPRNTPFPEDATLRSEYVHGYQAGYKFGLSGTLKSIAYQPGYGPDARQQGFYVGNIDGFWKAELSNGVFKPAKRTSVPKAAYPKLTTDQASGIANAAANKAGYALALFHPPEAKYDWLIRDGHWSVTYQGKGGRRGNHFGVRIRDETGEAQIFRGR